MLALQMVNHVAPWEDEDGWTHNSCPNGYKFPDMLCSLSRYLGYPQCPEYMVVMENEEQVHQVQRLESHHLKQQVGQRQAANTALIEQVGAAQDQNADLQIATAELNHQLQHILINDGINMQLEINAEEEEEERTEF